MGMLLEEPRHRQHSPVPGQGGDSLAEGSTYGRDTEHKHLGNSTRET